MSGRLLRRHRPQALLRPPALRRPARHHPRPVSQVGGRSRSRAPERGRRARSAAEDLPIRAKVGRSVPLKAERLKGWKAERKPRRLMHFAGSFALAFDNTPLRSYALLRWSDLGPLATSLKKAKLPPYETCFFRGPTSLPAWGFFVVRYPLSVLREPPDIEQGNGGTTENGQRPTDNGQRTTTCRTSSRPLPTSTSTSLMGRWGRCSMPRASSSTSAMTS